MIVYGGVLIALGFIFLLYNSNLARSRRVKNLLYALAWLILLLVSGLRYEVGTDYPHYIRNYSMYMNQSISLVNQPAMTVVAWVSSIIYDDYATWFFLMAMITMIPAGKAIKRDSSTVCMSTVLFVLLCCWHTSFNIVKQSAAMAFIMLGSKNLMDRKFGKWCLYCALAAMFHISAVLMIPMYFLIDNQVNWKRCLLMAASGLVIMILYDELFGLMGILRGTFSETSETGYGARDLNILRVLVNCAPIAMALVMRKYYDLKEKRFAVLFNLSFFNAVLNIATMSSAYLNRFAIYTIPFNALFIPYLVKPFKRKSRVIIWCVILVLYAAFFAYDLYKGSTTRTFHWIFERGY